MLVTDIVQRAVAGSLRFDFIESTITAMRGGTLSSQKGQASCDLADGVFLYHFQPRGELRDDWLVPGGYLDMDAQDDSTVFHLEGVERSSSTWTARALQLRLVRSLSGATIHGRVKEWSRADERSAHSSFARVIVPGHYLYPTTVRHAPGNNTRGAAVSFEGMSIEFRDYGHYTEISAVNAAEFSESFPDVAVAALARVLETSLNWVYKEQHRRKQRIITVQQPSNPAAVLSVDTAGSRPPGISYSEFWRAYREELAALL